MQDIFIIQWHLTKRCSNRCVHCYMHAYDCAGELDVRTVKDLLLQIKIDFAKISKRIRINFTGGDPLLYNDIFEVVEYARSLGIIVDILGNPQTIDDDKAEKLQALGIDFFQLSLDGLPQTHNTIRQSVNAYSELKRGAEILYRHGIPLHLMYTLRKENLDQLSDCARIAKDELHAAKFSFSRDINDDYMTGLTPIEYRSHLNGIYKQILLKEDNIVALKENLWKLFLSECGILNPENFSEIERAGCGLGYSTIAVMPDGTVYPCSHIPYCIGNVNQNPLIDLFSAFSKKYEQEFSASECAACKLNNLCRGCPAVNYAKDHDYVKKDIHCWTH